ncbi:D-ribose pyranase [Rubrobacter aplysinae]|uniref:D-ribose pyranase n=1 Tax=Rubrobacter aplysinae TaxID=909625 RepID=UPI00064C3700|nr:D-ribose pyranase [Rubrobacter aplysinae]
MKRGGIINAQLSGALARLGHTDGLLICDAGLPLPSGPEVVDLAFEFGTPTFKTVLDGILRELIVERATAAMEAAEGGYATHQLLVDRLPVLDIVPHEELKRRGRGAKLVVRTGADIPYSNVILYCGVPF